MNQYGNKSCPAKTDHCFERLLMHLLELHRGRKRQNGMPYITHLLDTASCIGDLTGKLIALAHDYAEFDSPEELLSCGFPEQLLGIVIRLKRTFPADIGENAPEYQTYLWNLVGDPVVSGIKYSDLASNKMREETPPDRNVSPKKYTHAAALLEEAAGKRLWFYSKSYLTKVFSNFYADPIEMDGFSWPSVEHYYQAQKFAPGSEVWHLLRHAETAKETKLIADSHKDEIRSAWTMEFKMERMKSALNVKFRPASEMNRLLQMTGDLELIHESRDDFFWGCDRNGNGDNLLGKLLMEIRGKTPYRKENV